MSRCPHGYELEDLRTGASICEKCPAPEQAHRTEDPMSLLPRVAFDGMMDVERLRVATALRKRADWLRSEYLNGGNFEHLNAREQECRYIATQIEERRL